MNTHKLVSVGATTALVFTLYGCGQPQTGASAATATTFMWVCTVTQAMLLSPCDMTQLRRSHT